eukprot:2669662-Amphidinium_carterae.1
MAVSVAARTVEQVVNAKHTVEVAAASIGTWGAKTRCKNGYGVEPQARNAGFAQRACAVKCVAYMFTSSWVKSSALCT